MIDIHESSKAYLKLEILLSETTIPESRINHLKQSIKDLISETFDNQNLSRNISIFENENKLLAQRHELQEQQQSIQENIVMYNEALESFENALQILNECHIDSSNHHLDKISTSESSSIIADTMIASGWSNILYVDPDIELQDYSLPPLPTNNLMQWLKSLTNEFIQEQKKKNDELSVDKLHLEEDILSERKRILRSVAKDMNSELPHIDLQDALFSDSDKLDIHSSKNTQFSNQISNPWDHEDIPILKSNAMSESNFKLETSTAINDDYTPRHIKNVPIKDSQVISQGKIQPSYQNILESNPWE